MDCVLFSFHHSANSHFIDGCASLYNTACNNFPVDFISLSMIAESLAHSDPDHYAFVSFSSFLEQQSNRMIRNYLLRFVSNWKIFQFMPKFSTPIKSTLSHRQRSRMNSFYWTTIHLFRKSILPYQPERPY